MKLLPLSLIIVFGVARVAGTEDSIGGTADDEPRELRGSYCGHIYDKCSRRYPCCDGLYCYKGKCLRGLGPSGSGPGTGPSGSGPFTGPSGSGPFTGPSGSGPFTGPSGSGPFTGPSSSGPFTGPSSSGPGSYCGLNGDTCSRNYPCCRGFSLECQKTKYGKSKCCGVQGSQCNNKRDCCSGFGCRGGRCRPEPSIPSGPGSYCGLHRDKCSRRYPCCRGLGLNCGPWKGKNRCCGASGAPCDFSGNTACCDDLKCKKGKCCAYKGKRCSKNSPCCPGLTCKYGSGHGCHDWDSHCRKLYGGGGYGVCH